MIELLVILVVILALAIIGGCVGILVLVLQERAAFLRKLTQEQTRWMHLQEALSERFIQAVEKVISYAREEHEAGAIALKMAALIDARVEARTAKVTVDAKTGNVIATPRASGNSHIPEQPPDPNVRQSGLIDEVHEAERDAERILNPDAEFASRDEREFMG